MADTTEYAPATEDALPEGGTKKKRIITWLAIGGAVVALAAVAVGAALTSSGPDQDYVAAEAEEYDPRQDAAEWVEWAQVAVPILEDASDATGEAEDALRRYDTAAAASVLSELSRLVGSLPATPSAEMNAKIDALADAWSDAWIHVVQQDMVGAVEYAEEAERLTVEVGEMLQDVYEDLA